MFATGTCPGVQLGNQCCIGVQPEGVLTWVLFLFVAFMLCFRRVGVVLVCQVVDRGYGLIICSVAYNYIPRWREGRGGVGICVRRGHREAGLVFTLSAHPAVQVGGQHCEMGIASLGTELCW